ncbi:MAG: hypothetical protein K1Y36_10260 [Blastocatellia bacterium]|nr:hypothetical protein [Blastocatellia bacterium]
MAKAKRVAKSQQEILNSALTEWATLSQQIAPQVYRMKQLEAQIDETIKAISLDAEGQLHSNSIETETAKVALMVAKVRTVDAKRFITSVAETNRNEAFWDCLWVGAARAEKFLPADVFSTLAEVNTEVRIKMWLKPTFPPTIT